MRAATGIVLASLLRLAIGTAVATATITLAAGDVALAADDGAGAAKKKKAAKKVKKTKKATKTDAGAPAAASAQPAPAPAATPTTPGPSASPAAAGGVPAPSAPPEAKVPAAPAESAIEKLARSGPPSKKVQRTWRAKCASCHGEDGKGETEEGRKMGCGDMTTAAFWKGLDDAHLRKAVREGFKRDKGGKQQEMKAVADQLSPGEIDAVLALALAFRH